MLSWTNILGTRLRCAVFRYSFNYLYFQLFQISSLFRVYNPASKTSFVLRFLFLNDSISEPSYFFYGIVYQCWDKEKNMAVYPRPLFGDVREASRYVLAAVALGSSRSKWTSRYPEWCHSIIMAWLLFLWGYKFISIPCGIHLSVCLFWHILVSDLNSFLVTGTMNAALRPETFFCYCICCRVSNHF